ncbi:MAG: hypothetical protein LBC96_02620 [Lachnospiraceae bacterium]|jgi:Cdc6-like AAA superfamily ATPase|nr:hypothetical protein [Lachnospiraceae bacterium]
MEAVAIIKEIDNLPTYKRIFIVEQIIRSIRREKMEETLEIAAERLFDDYQNDSELTAFTQLDCEEFYEPR